MLVKKVNPVYPKEARKKHVQAIVMLHAFISKQGDITQLEVVSGDPLLGVRRPRRHAAMEISSLRFSGQPVEVETEIQVNFTVSP